MQSTARPSPGPVLLALASLAVAALPCTAADPRVSPERIAQAFATGLFEGRDEDIAETMTPQVKAAMTQAQSAQLRAGLAAQNGAFKSTGPAWHEDTVQGLRRYRVPVQFENTTLDMRVVLDAADQVAGLFFVAHIDPPQEDDSTPPVAEFQVELGAPPIPGTISRPPGEGPFPAVVLIHGSGPNDRDETLGPNKPFRDLAWGLAQEGVLVLRYDKRSFARPDDLARLGDALTVQHEVLLDARAALGLLRGRKDTDAKRIFVLGHSLGGSLAPRIAGEEPRPAGIIALAGSTLPLPEKMLEQTRYILKQSGDNSAAAKARLEQLDSAVTRLRQVLENKAPAPDGPLLGVPVGYFRDLEQHDPPTVAAALGLPALILQGVRDYQVTLEDFARWKAALEGRPGACLKTYADLDHLFRKGSGPSTPADYDRRAPVDPEVIRDIAAWILRGACPK